MTAAQLIDQFKALPLEEKVKVEAYVQSQIDAKLLAEEPPQLLAAIDEGLGSIARNGGKTYTRSELDEKVRVWASGKSR